MCYGSNDKIVVFRYTAALKKGEKLSDKTIMIASAPVISFSKLQPLPDDADSESYKFYIDKYFTIITDKQITK